MGYLLALDQGTTSSRALVFDTDGAVRSAASLELTQHYPHPGWVEHDPDEIWRTQLDTARQALAKAGIGARDVLALGIANQRETVVLWERATGRPLHPAIVWQDRRTAEACSALRAQGLEPLFRERTGLLLDPYFSGTKLAWLLDHVPGARARAERGELAFGTIDSWLLWQLTGGRVHATDVSNASRTMLFDIRHNVWDHELLKALHVPDSVLPQVMSKLKRLGIRDSTVGLVIPTGYSFNLDGSTLYLALASVFVAQAAGVDMPLSTQLLMMLTLMLTSKGVAAVPRASLVILSGTLASFGLPLEGVAVILGVDAIELYQYHRPDRWMVYGPRDYIPPVAPETPSCIKRWTIAS